MHTLNRSLSSALLGVALGLCMVEPLFAADRVALLIGVSDYRDDALDLRNPANDARGLSEALEALDFSVEVVLDADLREMGDALLRFESAATGAEMALFFFAGHGLQIDGENFLLSAGFERQSLSGVIEKSLPLGAVRDILSAARPKIGVVILDACRDNPFGARGLVQRGLARSRGGSGVLIAYATDPGNVAYDGSGENSYFTEALIRHIGAPSLEARLMFGRVRQQVAMTTDGAQVPWVEESVLGEHYFNTAPRQTTVDPEIERDIEAWRTASAAGDAPAYADYLRRFPEGLFAAFAEERIALLRAAAVLPDEAAGTDVAITEEDRERLTFALATLGFLSQTRGTAAATETELRAGLARYERQMAGDAVRDLEQVYLDAAQVMVVLGSSTAQRIRTDMAALKSIDLTLGMAERAYDELAGLAEADADAAGVLPRAAADIAAIEAARAKVLDRLDDSRSYYAGLVERGRADFGPYLERSMAALLEKSRSLPAFESRLFADADTFIRHASAGEAQLPEGSYAWIVDLLPPG
jgi:hypothetical protein